MGNIESLIDRTLATLKADPDLAREVREFRFGEMGTGRDRETAAHQYPVIYVTVAPSPEVERRSIGSSTINSLPPQQRIYEIWAVVVADGPTPEEAQRRAYNIAEMAAGVLERNVQLRNDVENNPLAAFTDIMIQRRLVAQAGSILEAMTIRLRSQQFYPGHASFIQTAG